MISTVFHKEQNRISLQEYSMTDRGESIKPQVHQAAHLPLGSEEENDGAGPIILEEQDPLSIPLLSDANERSCAEDFDDSNYSLTEITPTRKSWMGPLLLLFVSFLFATLNVSLRSLYLLKDPPSPAALSATRGWLTMAMFFPVLVGHQRIIRSQPQVASAASRIQSPTTSKSIWRAAGDLAIWNFMGQALYNWGMVHVSSARASFLGQTTVVFIPLICALAGDTLTWMNAVGCLSSLVGLILLSVQQQSDHNDAGDASSPTFQESPSLSLGLGDILILASAVCWSLYVINTSKLAHAYDVIYLQGTKNALLAALYSVWFATAWWYSNESLWPGWRSGVAWAILIYTAFGPGILADLIQQKGQASTGPTESNLILCMESVFTAILGRVLLGEETSWIEKLGGLCLVAGALISGQQQTI